MEFGTLALGPAGVSIPLKNQNAKKVIKKWRKPPNWLQNKNLKLILRKKKFNLDFFSKLSYICLNLS